MWLIREFVEASCEDICQRFKLNCPIIMESRVLKSKVDNTNLVGILELWLNSLGQLLAQFHTPLIIGVDVPDHLEIVVHIVS